MKHKRLFNSLDSFKLFFEEMEMKMPVRIKKPEPKMTLKQRVSEQFKKISDKVNSLKRANKTTPTRSRKLVREQRKARTEQRKRVILGIGLLLVIVSIAYSTTVVREFVDSSASLVALAPQVIFAVVILIKAFSKLYK